MSALSPAVPFADLHAQYLSIKPDIDATLAEVIRTSAFIRGPFVTRFESAFAEAVGMPHCVSCANGTDSLYIAMKALGIKPGDEVIAPAHSWISTTETITQAGATVVFCDTDPHTFTIDPAQLAQKITPRTVGIIPVHLYGQAADMDQIMALAGKHKLWVIEDCAQAHLAQYKGRMVGSFGHAASYSFYPGKNLGAMGDAGAIVTRDAALADRMAMFARHGGLTKGDCPASAPCRSRSRQPNGSTCGTCTLCSMRAEMTWPPISPSAACRPSSTTRWPCPSCPLTGALAMCLPISRWRTTIRPASCRCPCFPK
jgi:dTDP-4-amino-4,6-dideoxygalactose transaminase